MKTVRKRGRERRRGREKGEEEEKKREEKMGRFVCLQHDCLWVIPGSHKWDDLFASTMIEFLSENGKEKRKRERRRGKRRGKKREKRKEKRKDESLKL